MWIELRNLNILYRKRLRLMHVEPKRLGLLMGIRFRSFAQPTVAVSKFRKPEQSQDKPGVP